MVTLPLYMYIVYNALVIKLYTKEFYLFFVEDVLMRKGTSQKLYMYIRYPIFMEIFLYFTFVFQLHGNNFPIFAGSAKAWIIKLKILLSVNFAVVSGLVLSGFNGIRMLR